MIKSMTAFSRQDDKTNNITLNWEIRSVNHRHLDIVLHMPEALNAHENTFKEIIRKKLGRGRLDIKLTAQSPDSQSAEKIQLNEAKVKALLSVCSQLKLITHKSANLSAMEILQWPGVMEEALHSQYDYTDAAKNLLEKALDELISMRETEGARLLEMIESRCDSIVIIVKSVKARRAEVIKALREKVLNKLAELDVSADKNRLEQELVYQAQRLDTDEELDRLGAHIEEISAVLKRDEPVGRRLDFLMQELNREANTLASKSNDAETTKSAVELKVLIEQMREQCLNIE